MVVGDSYFTSVPAVLRLKGIGLRYIGAMKTATREYPMDHLFSIQVNKRFNHSTMDRKNSDGDIMMATITFVDRDRKYFFYCKRFSIEGRVS